MILAYSSGCLVREVRGELAVAAQKHRAEVAAGREPIGVSG